MILRTTLTTPLGKMIACATEQGVCLLEFSDKAILEKSNLLLQKRFNQQIIDGKNNHLIQLEQELGEYFNGQRKQFNVKLDIVGTAFQKSVWQVLQSIEYGSTISYQAQSEQLGNPKAIRAVASANGANLISIIIPCHRVIGKNGSLTGYAGGLERKKWLIEFEQKHKVKNGE
ncbi:Methylated-DNA--protein-cysteine methyltransferase, constitutive [Phocoenobacter uteri]|uniref:Methylated-DNA--protein-cysteine methyltransferase n=1 Tax=Phocoenobacter uteri TaxID=146806 RepID=A0A379CA58_9PAST|nr:methylated-DNA--[protein]-cysteine S-methyltransferase [Phocoenobacter uteri]MDG6882418.1 hypothetical protein [Phocoenobacter uteri]SUB58576.1 Methylated-DNA--protein-cysteine methyltransferase, constitutive [Phocoenobacter uteri]